MHDATAERVGPYRIERRLGAGGMGTVYLAHDDEEHRAVALKVLDPALVDRRGFFQRFEREARAGLRVDHANVVRTLDYGFHMAGHEPRCYLAMEYVEGRTLRALLEDLTVVPEALVLAIARQVAAGLAAIHAAGVVHRDVKPENVLITRDHQVRIMDLGVAKVLDASVALTQEGQFAGSLHYAAPEQFGLRPGPGAAQPGHEGPAAGGPTDAAPIDGRADLYSLGVVLHELASGSHPFTRETAAAVVHAQLHETPPELTDLAPDFSPFLSDVVSQLLEKDPSKRFASAEALLAILDAGESSPWWREREEARRRRKSSLPRVPVRRETTLHGREADLALLADLWTKARSGAGSTLLVEGEAGIGKSRLVDAFVQSLSSEPCHVLYGSYSPSGGLGGLSDAIVGRFGAARLDVALRPYVTATPALVAPFAALLRSEAPPEGAPPLAGSAVHAVFVHLMRGLAAEKPLVWIVEDLHFATEDVRKIVLSLARAVEGCRVLLVLTSRPPVPEQEAAHLARTGNFRRTSLGRLGAKDVVQLIRDAFRNERLVEKLGLRIAEKSDGVPFFVFEMIRGLKEGQFVTQLEDGSWVESKVIERIDVPSAVKDLIAVRLADLSREQREILDVGAVHGFEFDPDLVGAVLERRPLAVLQDLAHVERRLGVVRPAGRHYRFDHHQIQEVLYADLSQGLREGYHSVLAEAMETRAGAATREPGTLGGLLCVELAEHFLAGNAGARALRYLDAGLRHLERSYLNEQAVRLVERALSMPGLLEGGARGDLLRRLAQRLDLLGWRERERAVIDEAIALARSARDRQAEAVSTRLLGSFLASVGRLEEALEHGARSLALAREIGDVDCEAAVTINMGIVLRSLGRHAEARDHAERGLVLARRCGNRRWEGNATSNLGNVCWSVGRTDEAIGHYERHLALARSTGDRWGEAMATGNLGSAHYALGRYTEARAYIERQLTLIREVADRDAEASTWQRLGAVSQAMGHLAAAREQFERSRALALEVGDRLGAVGAAFTLGFVLRRLGQVAEARELVEQSLRQVREIGGRSTEGEVLGTLAEIVSELGDAPLAVRLATEALDLSRASGERRSEADCRVVRGEALEQMGSIDDARADFDAALALAREISHPGIELIASAHLARLSGAEVPPALEVLRANEGRSGPEIRASARFLLWQATRDRVHLVEAKRLLDFLVEHAPPECRGPMLRNVRLHREIDAAAKEAGI